MGIIKWLDNNLEKIFLVAMLVFMSILIMFQVIMRYIFHNALGWPEELARYSFILFSFMTLGFCIKNKSNFRIDQLVKKLPEVVQSVLNILVDFGFLFFYSFCFYYSLIAVEQARATGNITTGLQMPVFILYIIAGAGLLIGALRAVQSIVTGIVSFKSSSDRENMNA